MYEILFLSFFACLFSYEQSSMKELDVKVKDAASNKNQIVFIFKKQDSKKSPGGNVDFLGSDIYYSEKKF